MPVGFDNWQVWPYSKGEGDTGKSTVIDIVRAIFHLMKWVLKIVVDNLVLKIFTTNVCMYWILGQR